MAKSGRGKQVTPTSFQRPGEGVLIDIMKQVSVRTNGTSVTTIGVDLSHAPVPERRYVAEAGWVRYSDHTIKLLFGQWKMSPQGGLRTMLVIHMNPHAVAQFLTNMDQIQKPDLAEIMRSVRIETEKTDDTRFAGEPDQTVAFSANIVAAAIAGPEACLDFYEMSAFAIANAKHSSSLPIDAVVRVSVRTGLFAGMLGAMKELAGEFPDVVETQS